MNGQEKERLIFMIRRVVGEENLPQPKRILIRQPLQGHIRTLGRCRSNKIRSFFNLTIQTMKSHYYPNVEGKWVDAKTKQRMSRKNIPATMDDILRTTAHEIAHIKFWEHDAQHHSYTLHILEKLQAINNEV